MIRLLISLPLSLSLSLFLFCFSDREGGRVNSRANGALILRVAGTSEPARLLSGSGVMDCDCREVLADVSPQVETPRYHRNGTIVHLHGNGENVAHKGNRYGERNPIRGI